MSEKFEGDRKALKEYGNFLINLADELDCNFKWKAGSYLMNLYLNRDVIHLWGEVVNNKEVVGQECGKFVKETDNKVLFFLKEDNEYPLMIGEGDKDNLKVYLTNFGARGAQEIALEIRNFGHGKVIEEMQRNPEKKISLDEWAIELSKTFDKPMNYNYILDSLHSFLGRNIRKEDRCELCECVRKLINSGKWQFKDGKYEFKEDI